MARREISVIVSASYSPNSYRFVISLVLARVLAVLAALMLLVVLAALVLLLGSGYRMLRLSYLERRNQALEAELARVGELKRRLERLEQNSRNMAAMLGVEAEPPEVDWDAAPDDSTALPDWVVEEAWGSHPVPVLVPLEQPVVSRSSSPGHEAVDLAARPGQIVRASGDGVVVERAQDKTYGRYLLVQHDSGYQTFYGHLQGWMVRVGDTVLAGQGLARVDSGSRSSAPHLHFEIRRHGRCLDPRAVLRF